MIDRRRLVVSLLTCLLGSAGLLAQEAPLAEKPTNWPAPLFWNPPEGLTAPQGKTFLEGQALAGLHPEQAQSTTAPLPFISISPCRMLDTRTTGGPIASGFTRDVTLTGAPCSIPSSAAAVSANFVVFNIVGAPSNGVLKVWPAGSPSTFQALINWSPTAGQLDNASVVPLGTGGAITLQPNQGGGTIAMVIDVNGYYAPETTIDTGTNAAYGYQALYSNTTGGANAAYGFQALHSNTTGGYNSAFGTDALANNLTGGYNAAFGMFALFTNTAGGSNAAFGNNALYANTTGGNNAAFGNNALYANTTGDYSSAFGSGALLNNQAAGYNSAFGYYALYSNQTGGANAAFGSGALDSNFSGSNNAAFGTSALHNTSGGNNIGIGTNAGLSLYGGSNNIYIGADAGSSSEGNTIRIGTPGTHSAAYLAGVYGVTISSGSYVFVSSGGQLGVAPSSRRFKEEIVGMGAESDVLMKLRPVSFFYKPEYDDTRTRQYGLVAEEVAEVAPSLVVYGKDGQPETVRYHFVNAMLLNEVQKQRQVIEDQSRSIERQTRTSESQARRLDELRSQLEDQSREIEVLKEAVASLTRRPE